MTSAEPPAHRQPLSLRQENPAGYPRVESEPTLPTLPAQDRPGDRPRQPLLRLLPPVGGGEKGYFTVMPASHALP
jgi:hypothetical protein